MVDEISSNPTDHCTVLAVLNHGQKHFKCNHCGAEFKGTGTRCYVHLTGDGDGVAACLAVSEEERRGLRVRLRVRVRVGVGVRVGVRAWGQG